MTDHPDTKPTRISGAPSKEAIAAAARVFYRSQTGEDLLATSIYADAWTRVTERALQAAVEADRPAT